MSKDSIFTYVHVEDPNQVLHMEKWHDDPIPYDDIDCSTLFDSTANMFPNVFLEEEDDQNLLINSMNFGVKFFRNKNKYLKDKIWNDLNLFETFLSGKHGDDNGDKTILKTIYMSHDKGNSVDAESEFGVGDFLSNGYSVPPNLDNLLSTSELNDSMMRNSNDISISDMNNNTFLNLRLNSIGNVSHSHNSGQQQQSQSQVQNQSQSQIQTPRFARTRQSSTDKNFQTPITRIMR